MLLMNYSHYLYRRGSTIEETDFLPKMHVPDLKLMFDLNILIVFIHDRNNRNKKARLPGADPGGALGARPPP